MNWQTLALLLAPTPILLMAADEIWLNFYFRSIPARSAFTTFNDPSPANPAEQNGLNRVFRKSRSNPDVFLVRGNDLAAAMDATARQLEKDMDAGFVIFPNDDGNIHQDTWVAFYAGTAGSYSPRWDLTSIRMEGRSIYVRYTEDLNGGCTKDLHRYWGWANLGKLRGGNYSLTLFNTTTNKSMRRTVFVDP